MKLKCKFQIAEVADETIAIPDMTCTDAFHGVLKVNKVALAILELLKTDTTEDAMVEALQQEYDATREDIYESVHRVVNKLRAAKLLAE